MRDPGYLFVLARNRRPGSAAHHFVLRCARDTRGESAVTDQLNAFRGEELLADVIDGLIGDARRAALAAASPIPPAPALLGRARGGGRPYGGLLGSRRGGVFPR